MVRILHEDEALLAVDKPAGALCVRGRMGEAEPSLMDELASARGEKLFIVHRLDRNTSGVLIFARTSEAHRVLGQAFEQGKVEKSYLALVRGAPQAEFTVEVPLVDARRGKTRPAAEGETGKPSLTVFRLVERFGEKFALVEALPKTGRTHQIRVHLKYAGFPLAVDPQYTHVERIVRGDLGLAPADEVVLARTPLHARRVRLTHPATGLPLEIESGLPDDLQSALGLMRGAAFG